MRKIIRRIGHEIKIARSEGVSGYLRYCIFRLSKYKTVRISKKGNNKRVYISYIPEALIRKGEAYLNFHQNRREMKIIVETFLKFGFDVVVQDYRAPVIKDRDFDVVFGLEPNFTFMSNAVPTADHVLYATGAYSSYANKMVKKRTDDFNRKYNTNLSYRRLWVEDESAIIADSILQIGSKFTLETYPTVLRHKIRLINQSSNYLPKIKPAIGSFESNKFLWLGSTGTVLKGVDLIIPYFKAHPEVSIDLVGPIEDDVIAVLNANEASNIRFRGYVDVNSAHFEEIIKTTCFLIYPSATEGGAPGAVNVAMKNGIIPITSRVASPSQISNLGYQIPSLDAEGIEQAMAWASSLTNQEIECLRHANLEYSNLWSLDNFRKEFEAFVADIPSIH